tara:strand:- start:421 stop:549 length:129 start_codon:yes stop_codon:yes gene_type:complete
LVQVVEQVVEQLLDKIPQYKQIQEVLKLQAEAVEVAVKQDQD